MKKHGMTVKEVLAGFQSDWDDSTLNDLSVVDSSEYSLLTQLDVARKRLDIELREHKEEVSLYPINMYKRCFLHSLRKYAQPITLKPDGHGFECHHLKVKDLVGMEYTYVVDQLDYGTYSALLERKAMIDFYHRNASVSDSFAKHLVPLMKKFIRRMLDGFREEFAYSPGQFGPGSVYEGFSTFERWNQLGRNPYWDIDFEDMLSWSLPLHDDARLCAVEKDWNKKRLITVEPYESSYLQQKIRVALSRTLVRNGYRHLALQQESHIDIPANHRRLCIEASESAARGDAQIDTTDLSNASDGISWNMVSSVFPTDVLIELERARSPYFTIPRFVSPNVPLSLREEVRVPMRIYAGMGNASTFLVEGIVFYSLLMATAEYYRIPNRKARVTSVFGDDLITPTGFADLYHGSLIESGFEINDTKSFWGTHPIRESCGCWAMNGVNLHVPAYKGYDESAKGQLGLAEWFRKAEDSNPLKSIVYERIKDWPHTNVPLENTVSVCVPEERVDWELSRYSSKLCGLEWRLKNAKPNHNLHLCVRRGGAYMMISRVPSQEGLSEMVPLVEVLTQSIKHVARDVSAIRELIHSELKRLTPSKRREEPNTNTKWSTNRMQDAAYVLPYFEAARLVAEYATHLRGRNKRKGLQIMCRMASNRVKPKTPDAAELVRAFRCTLGVLKITPRRFEQLMLTRVKVLKEAIPRSTTLRSSWVSKT